MSAAAASLPLTTDEEVRAYAKKHAGNETLFQEIEDVLKSRWWDDADALRTALMPLMERLRTKSFEARMQPMRRMVALAVDLGVGTFKNEVTVLASFLSPQAVRLLLVDLYASCLKWIVPHGARYWIQRNTRQVLMWLMEQYDPRTGEVDAASMYRAYTDGYCFIDCFPRRVNDVNFAAYWDETLAQTKVRDTQNLYQLTAPRKYEHLTARDRVERGLHTHERIGLGRDLDKLAIAYLDSDRAFKDGSSSSKDTDYMHD